MCVFMISLTINDVNIKIIWLSVLDLVLVVCVVVMMVDDDGLLVVSLGAESLCLVA